MSSSSIWLLVLVVLSVNGGPCPSNVVEIARKWTDKLNITSNPILMDQLFLETSTEDLEFTIKGVGTFAPRVIGSEYVRLVFPLQNSTGFWILPQITSRHRFDECALECNGNILDMYTYQSTWMNNTVIEDSNYNQNLDIDYNIKVKDLRLFTRLEFNTTLTSPSARIKKAFLQPERQWVRLFNSRPITVDGTCALIMAVCPAGSPLEQYPTFADCQAKLNSLATNTLCPYPTVSNTTACRAIHATSALIDPAVHCPHTHFTTSMTCQDSCAADCTNCHGAATCVDDYIGVTTPHYKCACRTSYYGDGLASGSGVTGCTKKECTNDGQCGFPQAFCNISISTCQCKDASLTWNSTTGLCGCLADETMHYDGPNSPKCLGKGKCFNDNYRYQCFQNYNSVKCKATPENPTAIFGSCICNYGYCGGYETDCKCLSPKVVKWSSFLMSNVCLTSTECTDDWHCPWPQTCTAKSATTGVGTCSA